MAGEIFKAPNSCGTCECHAGGDISCIEPSCACDPAIEHWRQYVAKDPGTCAVIFYSCPENTNYFGNECGCGCEQDPACPETCVPGKAVDCKAVLAKCPYTKLAP